MASSDQTDWFSSNESDNYTRLSSGNNYFNTGVTAWVDCECDIKICEMDSEPETFI